ncbi:MAG: serine/threonine protein kinase [Acetobacteraceae bacterium]|nr:serine/threonine protein kinase [Acetobacteraceae bacterium]
MESTSIGKYEIRAAIGRGAIGVVYEGWDSVLARKVAIKILPLPGTDEETSEKRSRFLREAQVAAGLHHPNIVGVYDYGETESSSYLVMELISGQSLKAILERGVRLPTEEVAAIMDGLLAGLQHSHDRGVVHRDIKPGNILISSEGAVKIADFGIARLESSEMTQVGAFLGTPAYMSPEQVRGDRVDARTDIYSAAVVLWQMLVGRRPFEGSTASILHKIVSVEPSLPPDLLATVSPHMGPILAKALAKRPEQRYASAREFALVLRNAFRRDETLASHRKDLDEVDTRIVARSDVISQTKASIGRGDGAISGSTNSGQARKRRRLLLPVTTACLLVAGAGWWVLAVPHGPATAPTLGAHNDATLRGPPALTEPPSHPQATPSKPGLTLKAALSDAIAGLPCSLLSVASGDGGGFGVGGLTALGDASELEIRAVLGRVIAKAAASAPIAWNIRHVQGPYCSVLDVLRSARGEGSDAGPGPLLSLAEPAAHLMEGQTAQLKVAAPGAGGSMLLDYFGPDRSVTHLLDEGLAALGASQAGTSVSEADPAADRTITIHAPRGDGLVTLITSPLPVFGQRRPSVEDASTYLQDLKASLGRLGEQGRRVNVEALAIEGMPQ